MITSNYTEAYLRQRKFYLLLPLLALPFLTFAYWKLVVKHVERNQTQESAATGLQLNLPSADLKREQNLDKLAYYRKADLDSIARAQQIKKDPYRQAEFAGTSDSSTSALMGLAGPGGRIRRGYQARESVKTKSPQEVAVHQRLQALDKALTAAPSPSFASQKDIGKQDTDQPAIAQLEKMMRELQNQNASEPDDPEIAQLDGMLDKLLKLQGHPKADDTALSGQQAKPIAGLAVTGKPSDEQITLLGTYSDSTSTNAYVSGQAGFFGLNDVEQLPTSPGLTAVIEKRQQLVSGNTVQLRLTSPLMVAGSEIVENTFIYGIAALSGERLKIKINSLRSGDQILPVNLSVYDMDGIEGIFIPGTIERSVTKQQLGSQVQGYDLEIDGLSVGAQAASAGVQMGKMLLGRKTRLTQVTLQQGYKVLLRDANTNQ